MGDARLIQITPQPRIVVAIEAIDGRNGIDSLAQLCREKQSAGEHIAAHQAQMLPAAGHPGAERRRYGGV